MCYERGPGVRRKLLREEQLRSIPSHLTLTNLGGPVSKSPPQRDDYISGKNQGKIDLESTILSVASLKDITVSNSLFLYVAWDVEFKVASNAVSVGTKNFPSSLWLGNFGARKQFISAQPPHL
ncbi:hypothetical protein CEXT_634571 [Caerostris extrusa]|uniref:Uncharacterized protein n=1 Tax=Caerostris extrusa TaxID=172846 RepID=A0AAV4U6P6_CAEEX|nr:hypothetical protein CEXT_634571 [Caerostris extrusa]